MMDFNERVIPGVSANFLYQEALARYEFVLRFIKRDARVLDAGCGTGYGANLLSRKASVLGIDSDPETIKFARKNFGKRVNFNLGDIEEVNSVGRSLDVICAFEVIEHLKNPQKFLRNSKKVLKPGGSLFLSTPNRSVISPGAKVSSPYHLREYTLQEWERLLKKYFEKVEILGQEKSSKAKKAIKDFMNSQKSREKFVKSDALGIRKLIPPALKEKVWRILGSFFGRKSQEALGVKDFPLGQGNVAKSDYLIAICKK